MSTIDANNPAVQLGDLMIRAPGFTGVVDQLGTGSSGRAASAAVDPVLQSALRGAQLTTEYQVLLTQLQTNSPDQDPPPIIVELPSLQEGYSRLILSEDEGVYSWVVAPTQEEAASQSRGAGTAVYEVPVLPVREAEDPKAVRRGPIAKVCDKVVQVLEFAFRDQLGGIVRNLAYQWESKHRNIRLRSFTPADYRSEEAGQPHLEGFSRFQQGRCLLFVHGTFSKASSGFGEIAPEVFAELHQRYDGRVLAFDHHTLCADPVKNVQDLQSLLGDARLEVDIVCHSRGGLVAREICERVPNIRVRRIVFVGVPNAGTLLSEPDHMVDFLGSWTNSIGGVAEALSGPVLARVTDIAEGVVHTVKHLAANGVRSLPGLAAMNPAGDYLKTLSARGLKGVECYGIVSDYEARLPQLKAWIADRVMRAVFDHGANDLIVPCDGAFKVMPVMLGTEVLPHQAAVNHCGYFGYRPVGESILKWLS